MSALLLSSSKRVLPYLLFAYVFSLEASMAGMEFFGWLGFILTTVVFVFNFNKEPIKTYLKDWTLPEYLILGFFLVVILGAMLNTPEPTDRWFTVGRTRGILLLFGLKFLILLTFNKNTEKFLYVLFAVGMLASINAIYQYFTGVDLFRTNSDLLEKIAGTPVVYRTNGFFNSSMTFGHSLGALIALPFAFALMNPKKHQYTRVLFSAVTLVMGLALITTFTRGAWMGAVSALLVISFLRDWKTLMATLGTMVVVVFAATKIHPSLEVRVHSTFDTHSQSASERMSLWKANTDVFKEYPLLGIGYGENERVISEYFKKSKISSGYVGHAHSNFFQFLSGTGLLGTLCFYLFALGILIINLKLWFKVQGTSNWISAFLLGAIGVQVCLHVAGLTECNFKDMEINHLFIFVFAMVLALNHKIKRENLNQLV